MSLERNHPPINPLFSNPRKSGFSLWELVLVISLVITLTAVTLSAYTSFAQANALTSAATRISDVLGEARQDAITQNITVEVRLYDLPAQVGPSPSYHTLQLHWLKPDKTKPALQSPVNLPVTISFDSTAQHSTLIAENQQTALGDSDDPLVNGQTRIFHFLSDGSTDLDPAQPWFLTLRAATKSDPLNFPSDWACLTVDAATGRVQIFRP